MWVRIGTWSLRRASPRRSRRSSSSWLSCALSMVGLGQSARSIPISTAYAVWTGLGAALTVGYAVTFGEESATVVKVALIAGIVAAVTGLKVVGSSPSRRHRRG